MLVLASCSSPESDGEKAAKAATKCRENYFNELKEAFTDLIENFGSYNFTTRTAVREKVSEIENKSLENYEKAEKEAQEKYQEYEQKYIGKYKEYTEFQYSFRAHVKNCTIDDSVLDPLYRQINEKILTIIPGKPNVEKIKQTLVGRTINDNEEGYFGRLWQWKIEEGQVKDLTILSEDKNGDGYRYEVEMKLQGEGCTYTAKATIYYTLREYDDWTIEMLESKNVDVVRTGKYDNCIRTELEGEYASHVEIINNSDAALLVGGAVLEYNGWKKFAVTVKGNNSEYVGFYPKDYKIHFVERP